MMTPGIWIRWVMSDENEVAEEPTQAAGSVAYRSVG
jgi:hypothetical protein